MCACLCTLRSSATIPSPLTSGQIAVAQRHAQKTVKAAYESFWRQDVLNYGLDREVQRLIDTIDSQEMRQYFTRESVDVTTDSFLTSANLIDWFKFKKQGSAAVYAWLELSRGKKQRSFVADVAHWQTIEKERGREFVPTYLLLMSRTVESKKDRQAWADIFKAAYLGMAKHSEEKRSLLLLALSLKVWKLDDLRLPTAKHFEFLATELKRQTGVENGYTGMLAFSAYAANMMSKKYDEAAVLTRRMQPQNSALHFEFIAHTLGKNIEAARLALGKMEATSSDTERIEGYRKVVDEMEKIIQKEQSNQTMEDTK
jgi:hypothetical protein